jgi:hypothetical protein
MLAIGATDYLSARGFLDRGSWGSSSNEEAPMKWGYRAILPTACALIAASASLAEEAGGILRIASQGSPASLVTYKQDVAQTSLQNNRARSGDQLDGRHELPTPLVPSGIVRNSSRPRLSWDLLLARELHWGAPRRSGHRLSG